MRCIDDITAENAEELEGCLRSSVIIPERQAINPWLCRNRELKHGAATGAYSTDFFPPINQVLEEATSYKYPRIVLKAGVQSGKTECMMSIMLWAVSQDPSDIIFLVPRDTDKRAMMLERIKPAIAATPAARQCVEVTDIAQKATRDLSVLHNGGHRIRIRSAGTPMELASISGKILIADEVDKYPATARASGDPISLLQGRAKNYYDSVLIMACSPTVDWDPVSGTGSVIEYAYKNSNQNVWQCKCVHCGKYEHWNFTEHVRWDRQDPCELHPRGKDLPETARIECGKCGARMDESERMASMRAGRWFSLNPKITEARGFTWSRLLFPLSDLRDVVAERITAGDSMPKLQAFHNDTLAEVWRPGAHLTLTPKKGSKVKEFPLLKNSPKVIYSTVGVDVQGDRLEVVMLGFDTDFNPYVLEYRRLFGETSAEMDFNDEENVWMQLLKYMHNEHRRENAPSLNVQAIAIDLGYNGNRVYEFAAHERFNENRVVVLPVKGDNSQRYSERPFIQKKNARVTKRAERVHATVRSTMAVKIAQVEQHLLGVNQGKHDWAGLTKANRIRFCQQLPGDYYSQLQSESLVPKALGSSQTIWKRVHGANDALDATIYAFAAHRLLRLHNPIFNEHGLTRLKGILDGAK